MVELAVAKMTLEQIRPGVYVREGSVAYRIAERSKQEVLLEAMVGERDATGEYPKRWVSERSVLEMCFVYEGA